MAIKVYKNQKESPDRLVSRFNKKIQASRVLLEVKVRKFHEKKKTKKFIRQAAIMREAYRAKRNKEQFY